MTHATERCIAPRRPRRAAGLLVRMTAAVRALWDDCARATAETREELVIKQDLAHLGPHLLRDIGLNRDAQ